MPVSRFLVLWSSYSYGGVGEEEKEKKKGCVSAIAETAGGGLGV